MDGKTTWTWDHQNPSSPRIETSASPVTFRAYLLDDQEACDPVENLLRVAADWMADNGIDGQVSGVALQFNLNYAPACADLDKIPFDEGPFYELRLLVDFGPEGPSPEDYG